ncbi:hypothetical protein [Natronosalvus halobius]|uniref:hypothetical protein n=1 Tax=Natronosalvus halobius TaxID=2953746 RepID=UPI00209D8515|nr:hypothetical protein [Natronosalvus halobius]USZ73738.1 hypothetical protein NGM15_18550 [Natronosalvus halobius]
MAVQSSHARQTNTRVDTVDLRDLGSDVLPPEASHVQVTIAGDVPHDGTLVFELKRRWELDVALGDAEIVSVYDDSALLEKPATIPSWVSVLCSEFGIDEVTL